jgi:hypothetical protein
MTDSKQQTEERDELRDLDVLDEHAEAVKGGKRHPDDRPEYIVVTLKEALITT